MTRWRRLLIGFAVGGIVTLLAHPASRPLMTYSLAPSPSEVLTQSPLYAEPLELFPPRNADSMTVQERYITAYRIARRLNNPQVRASQNDLSAAQQFAAVSSDIEPDNAFWDHFQTALLMRSQKVREARNLWSSSLAKRHWSSGVSSLATALWSEVAHNDGIRLAWQGVMIAQMPLAETERFQYRECKVLGVGSLLQRYETLMNANIILRNATTFEEGKLAIRLANIATFNRENPNPSSYREVEDARSGFAADIASAMDTDAGRKASSVLRAVEAWEGFVQPAQRDVENEMRRLSLESPFTAALPSALLISSITFGLFMLLGKAMSSMFADVPHPDARIVLLIAFVGAGIAYVLTHAWAVGVWTALVLSSLALPVAVGSSDSSITSKRCTLILRLIGWLTLACMLVWLTLESPAGELMHESSTLSIVHSSNWLGFALIGLSLCLPLGALYAKVHQRAVLPCAGACIAASSAFGALTALFGAIVATPACIWRDSENRQIVLKIIENAPDAFREQVP